VQSLTSAADKAKEPLREFLLRHASPRELSVFHSLALRMRTEAERASISERDFLVLVPAFLASELRRAFEIGFLLFLPFLVIDLVVANLLLALGMNMLSPSAVSLPFKLLLFVLADGWQLLMRGLIEGYV
jgi:type III secretion protein R